MNGTYRIGQIIVVPRRLVDHFGPPGKCDEYKVSGQYLFTDAQNRHYSVYDWKETILYADSFDDADLPNIATPEEFSANENWTTLQVGGLDEYDLDGFRTWLAGEVE